MNHSGTALTPTQAQLGIWLGHESAKDPGIYNVAQMVVLGSATQEASLLAALLETLFEAEALHIAFGEMCGQPAIVPFAPTHSEAEIRRRIRNRVTRHAVASGELESWIRKQVAEPFDLRSGETFRHSIFSLSDGRIAWLHVAHHIVLDGYGFHLVARRVAERYGCALTGEAPSRDPFHTLDAVLDEDARYQESEQAELDRVYFRQLLGCRTDALSHLPRLEPSSPLRRSHRMPHELARALFQATSARGVSALDVFAAATARVWGKWGRVASLTLGLPVMQRMGTRALKVPCTAMNIAPLPVDLIESEGLFELSSRLGRAQRQQKKHQRLRYEHLPALLGVARVHSPVVNVLPFDTPLRFGGETAEVVDIAAGPVQDLSVMFTLRDRTWQISVDAHPHLFSANDAEALLADLELELCAAVEAVPPRRQAPSGERQHEEPFVAVDPLASISDHATRRPSQPALATAEGSFLTYGELRTAIKRGAELLVRHARPGDVIAIDLPRGLLSVVWLLSILEAGCTYLVLDAGHPPARRAAILRHAAPKLLLCLESKANDASFTGPCLEVTLGELLSSPPEIDGDATVLGLGRSLVSVEAPAYLVFTSGSTGHPKAVVVSRRALAHFVGAAQRRYGVSDRDRVLQFASLAFDASVEEIFVTLCSGGTLVLRDDAMLDSAARFLQQCARLRLSVLDLPTAYFHEFASTLPDHCIPPWPELRLVIVGGEALRPADVHAFSAWAPKVRLINSYGPSEATVVATAADVTSSNIYRDAVPIGRPLLGVGVQVLSDEGQTISQPWREGQLFLSGPTLADGYLADPEQTDARFIRLDHRGRAYATGDRVCWDFAGQLVYRGRLDDQLKIAGQRIDPAEVELTLCQLKKVEHAVVWAHRRSDGGLVLRAAVESGLNEITAEEVREHASRGLPPSMVPVIVDIHRLLPRNAAGKIDRVRVKQSSEMGSEESPLYAPASELFSGSPLERTICATWKEILGIATVAPTDDFFALGGTSLMVIQLVNRLFERGVVLSVRQVFRAPTPAAQAALASSEGRDIDETAPFSPADVPLRSRTRVRQRSLIEDRSSEPLLLTGATGFVGAHVLLSCLELCRRPIVCLVRAANREEALRRIFEGAAARGIEFGSQAKRIDVRCISGEKSSDQWLQRLPPCSTVIHAAASVSLNRDYQSLLPDNVLLTRDLLEWASTYGAEFHFVSSLAVVPRNLLRTPQGEKVFDFHADIRDGYQRSKLHAERLCEQARGHGLKVAIHRLGRITGAKAHPSVNPQDIVWRIVRSATRLGYFPRLLVEEPWTPVDEVAKRIVRLVLLGSAFDERNVYHLNSPLMDFARLHAALARNGFLLQSMELEEWLGLLGKSSDPEDRATLAFFELRDRSELPRLPAPIEQREDGQGFGEIALCGFDPALGGVDDALLDGYIGAARASGLLAGVALESPCESTSLEGTGG